MSNLFFPRPAGTGSTSALTLNTPSITITTDQQSTRAPPNNFAEARIRSAARELRRANVKSPFVPSKGKLKDISDLSIEDLKEMLLRNSNLLNTPSLVAALPTGDSKLLASQIRIKLRIEELEELQEIRKNLQSTHLDESGNNLDLNNLLDDLPNSKQTLSPRTKQRLAEMNMTKADKSKLTTMSLSESMALQRIAATRAREESEKRSMKMEVDAARSQSVGGLLKGAMKNVPEMSGFMFHEDSDDEDQDDAGDFGLSGDLDNEEDEHLNPYKAAYLSGYERAEAEAISGRDEG